MMSLTARCCQALKTCVRQSMGTNYSIIKKMVRTFDEKKPSKTLEIADTQIWDVNVMGLMGT